MPTGLYFRRREANSFIREYPTQLSKVATDWLAHIELTENISIAHNRNGKEYQVGPRNIRVDGYHR